METRMGQGFPRRNATMHKTWLLSKAAETRLQQGFPAVKQQKQAGQGFQASCK